MLASFTDLQTGQQPRRGSQDLHEQRCLQGKKRKHEVRELQRLHAIFLHWSFTSSPPSPLSLPLPSSSLLSMGPPPYDSASSAPLLSNKCVSLTCSSMLFRYLTIASFSVATRCHPWLSTSLLLNQSSSSIIFFLALAKSSSFCLIRVIVFDSNLFNSDPSCCFRCSCKANFNLSSYCTKYQQNSNSKKTQKEKKKEKEKKKPLIKRIDIVSDLKMKKPIDFESLGLKLIGQRLRERHWEKLITA